MRFGVSPPFGQVAIARIVSESRVRAKMCRPSLSDRRVGGRAPEPAAIPAKSSRRVARGSRERRRTPTPKVHDTSIQPVASHPLHAPCDRHDGRERIAAASNAMSEASCACVREQFWQASARASQPHERLHHAAEHTVEPQVSLHRDETDAILTFLNDGLVIDGVVAEVEIARPEIAALVSKAPDSTQVNSMPVWECSSIFVPGRRPQQKHPRRAFLRQVNRAQMHRGATHCHGQSDNGERNRASPEHRSRASRRELRRGKAGSSSRASTPASAPPTSPPAAGRRGLATDMLHRAHRRRQCGQDKVRCDGYMLAKIERAGRKRHQQFLRGMVLDRHERSPSRPRNRFIASRTRDLTVPSGIQLPRNFGMRLLVEEGQLDHAQLIVGTDGSRRRAPSIPPPTRPDLRRVAVLRRPETRLRSRPYDPAGSLLRRRTSMRRLRAIVKIQAAGADTPGVEQSRLRQTVSRVSCASSSARCSLAPDRRMKVLIRGAKYSNTPRTPRGPDAPPQPRSGRPTRRRRRAGVSLHHAARRLRPACVSYVSTGSPWR